MDCECPLYPADLRAEIDGARLFYEGREVYMKANYITPAVTVFSEDGSIHFEEQGKVYEHLIAGGVDGILILGSIGEFFALSMEQKKELIRFAVKTIDHRVRLIAGTTSMIFDEILELSEYADQEGVDGVMVLPPYYFPISEAGMVTYFGKIAESLPQTKLYLYNFPDRTGCDITPDVTVELVKKYENIKGYKDTQAGMDHTRELIRRVKAIRPDFEIYSGFDDNFAHNILAGGDGCIAGLSNVFPRLTSGWAEAFRKEDLKRVQEIQERIDALMQIYQVGKPFVPYIKAAMQEEGILTTPKASFPFPEVTEEDRVRIRSILPEGHLDAE